MRSTSCGSRDRALDERQVIRSRPRRHATPRGSRRSRPDPPRRAARPRSPAASADSRRRMRTSRPRASGVAADAVTSASPRAAVPPPPKGRLVRQRRRTTGRAGSDRTPGPHTACCARATQTLGARRFRRRRGGAPRRASSPPARTRRTWHPQGVNGSAVRPSVVTTPTSPRQRAVGGIHGQCHMRRRPAAPRARAHLGRAARRACVLRPARRCGPAAHGRRATSRTTGRKGARPIPPATITTSDPARRRRPTPPNGPRTPTMSPERRPAQRPRGRPHRPDRVTELALVAGTPADRDGTSPTPNA